MKEQYLEDEFPLSDPGACFLHRCMAFSLYKSYDKNALVHSRLTGKRTGVSLERLALFFGILLGSAY